MVARLLNSLMHDLLMNVLCGRLSDAFEQCLSDVMLTRKICAGCEAIFKKFDLQTRDGRLNSCQEYASVCRAD